jgi:hypothetical protein
MRSNPFTGDTTTEATREAFNDPQPGDQFTEMFAFYVFVLRRDGNLVTFLEASAGQTVPNDGKVFVQTLSDFKAKYAYGSIPNYSIDLINRGVNVEGWAESLGIIDPQAHLVSNFIPTYQI